MNKKLEGFKAGLGNGLKFSHYDSDVFELDGIDMIEPFVTDDYGNHHDIDEYLFPHYFNLSYLAKEIRVEGYNDGKAFKMIDEMAKEFLYAAEWFTDIKEGQLSIQGFIYDNDEGVEVKQIVLINGEVSEECPLIHYRQMVKLHFNTEGIDPSDYIDASESKVYEPKKHESC